MKKFLNIFQQKKNTSAACAKERLQIIISHERGKSSRENLLANMQHEIVEVVAKHLNISADIVRDQIKLDVAQNQGHSILEVNITLPDEELTTIR
jgi:cell division topological specificity factor